MTFISDSFLCQYSNAGNKRAADAVRAEYCLSVECVALPGSGLNQVGDCLLDWVAANTTTDASGTMIPASEDHYLMIFWHGNELVENKRNVPMDLSKAIETDLRETASVLGYLSSGTIPWRRSQDVGCGPCLSGGKEVSCTRAQTGRMP